MCFPFIYGLQSLASINGDDPTYSHIQDLFNHSFPLIRPYETIQLGWSSKVTPPPVRGQTCSFTKGFAYEKPWGPRAWKSWEVLSRNYGNVRVVAEAASTPSQEIAGALFFEVFFFRKMGRTRWISPSLDYLSLKKYPNIPNLLGVEG